MVTFCGQVVTISSVQSLREVYHIKEDGGTFDWTDEMIEGLAEEETKPKFKVGDKITNGKEDLTILHITSDKYIVEDNLGEYDTLYFDTQNDWGLLREKVIATNEPFEKETEWNLPDGYQFKDENGNVINATKIVLEKKKKKYPETYEECCVVLEYIPHTDDIISYKWNILQSLQKLLICRDAYWKIAGEEMGLGKPWKPDWNHLSDKWVLFYTGNRIYFQVAQTRHSVFAFPTEEMRDAFKENFKELIEQCKELL